MELNGDERITLLENISDLSTDVNRLAIALEKLVEIEEEKLSLYKGTRKQLDQEGSLLEEIAKALKPQEITIDYHQHLKKLQSIIKEKENESLPK